ncbi:acetate--CoA ligase family protein [Aquihabitans sp. G128]|uniref:acetate--CoA ligase family protein n=1 Tax=Aquihabitans sp. G128 TaxID=2849779 RepID=UPI001C2344E5|nr:acetate--CoA ligase family protein [Aquihabitans sp. G128]QXC62051.1 acetate--CoA ligase family protein [Aquihabitans sp. G128]
MSARTLSEADSKVLLAGHGVPFAPEHVVATAAEAVAAASEVGFPVVLKLNGDAIAHKTERGLVRLSLADAAAVEAAAAELLGRATPEDGPVGLLVAPMLKGNRELIAGLSTDPQFGTTVMVGIGGIFAEALADVSVRPVPVSAVDAAEMIDDLATQALLGAFRGEPAVDRDALAAVILGLSAAAEADPSIASADLNPLIVVDGTPIAVDALVEVDPDRVPATATSADARPATAGFRALFDPKGVVVAGASSHPGKFGFVSLHNVLAAGYAGAVAATNRERAEVLGIQTVADIAELPDDTFDLIFVCTPASVNPDLLRAAAAKGITAAFITSAGYGEAGEAGIAAQADLVALCDELGILLAGPNGQGVVSTPSKLCAQIVAPYPPAGKIGVASQSGNFVSSFQNYAVQTGVGISRAVSAGNAAAVTVADFLDFYADDAETAVGLAYVEGVPDGRTFLARMATVTERKPLVLVKGGATAGGQQAAASHTGSLATDDRVFDGACRQAGITRAATVEEAFEAAATFATQPMPKGPRVVVMTTAGGWGVVTADAITSSDLELLTLPEDLLALIDAKLPPRWSKGNPVDLAGGETRDTIPEVLELIASHPDVDAVIQLGLGIQANQARLMRNGPFYPDHGIERIVAYHERQDARFAQAAADISDATGKPILLATELAVADPDNAGPATVRATGRLCYPSANRAVTALGHAWEHARWRQARGLPAHPRP